MEIFPAGGRRSSFATMMFLCGCLIWGCATGSSEDMPAWVMGHSDAYPASRYLLGVGEADSRSLAEERAYAAVAKIFQATVHAQSRDWQSYWAFGDEGEDSSRQRLKLDSLIQVSTEKVLEQGQVLDRWMDPDTGLYVVLAGIDRVQAERALLDRMAEYDADIEQLVTQASHATNKLEYLRNMHQAIQKLTTREADNADLRVIRESGGGSPAAYRLGALSRQLQQFLANRFFVQVLVQGDQPKALRGAMVNTLTRHGLLVMTDNQDAGDQVENRQETPDLVIRANSRLEDMDVPDPLFVYVRWCGELEILDPATHHILGAAADFGREGHVTKNAAKTRAAKAMQERMSSRLIDLLSTTLFGNAEPALAPTGTTCPH